MKEELLGKLKALREEALGALNGLCDLKALQDYKTSLLGKQGSLKEILRGLGSLSAEDRPIVGHLANKIKEEIEGQILRLYQTLEAKADAEKERRLNIDVTLPGLDFAKGKRHPLLSIQRAIEAIFLNLGFSVFEGPEIETDYYNFGALNFPENHPAKEMQDTFYIRTERPTSNVQINPKSQIPTLLRTHTSPVQIRVMEKLKPPIYMIAPGAVYRHDDDVTHSPMFHQVEGLMVDTHITFGDLKGVLTLFCQTLFGKERKVRFRPSFFPFVEPGAEVDISCMLCKQKGCRVCGGDGWLEILGAGMVHPNVLQGVKIDPKRHSGFAFGLGVERIAMLKYGINDIRLFYQSDMRFLEQF